MRTASSNGKGFGLFPEEGGHGRDFGGLNVSRYIAPVGQPIGVVDLVNGAMALERKFLASLRANVSD